MATLINGVSYNYANVQVSLLGVTPQGISAISYEQTSDNKHYYGLGYEPVALGYGNNVYTASLELQFEEAQALQNATAAAGIAKGDLTKLQPFDIIIQYGEVGQVITTHTLEKCVFMNQGVDAKSGDGTFVKTYNILPGSIIFA